MYVDVLKFFQGFIKHMVFIGGENLPKTVSTSMGRKLADFYIKKNVVNWQDALTMMIEGMGGKIEKIEKIENKEEYNVVVKYGDNFCPIGGQIHTKNASMIVDSICIPYTIGFISKFLKNYKIDIEFTGCIPRDSDNRCRAIFKFALSDTNTQFKLNQ